MGKGRNNLNLTMVAILSLVFAMLEFFLPVVLILGYAIIYERNRLLTKYTLVSTILFLVSAAIQTLINMFFSIMMYTSFAVEGGFFGGGFDRKFTSVIFLLFAALYIALMFGALSGQDLKIPFLDKMVSEDEKEE